MGVTRNRKVGLGAVAVAVATALVVPTYIGGTTDPWGQFIFNYQTLITGLAAVGAATWTISVMEKTDLRQENRHRELIELSLRSDRLKLERALNPQVAEIAMIARGLDQIRRDMLKLNTLAKQTDFIEENIWWIHYTNANLCELLDREAFREGEKLLNGGATFRLERVRQLAVQSAIHIRHVKRVLRPFPEDPLPNPPDLYMDKSAIYHFIVTIPNDLEQTCAMLSENGARYGITEASIMKMI